jgi:ABC-type thiamine transport system, periplasmic component
MSIRTLLAVVFAVAAVLVAVLALQAYQQTTEKRLVIVGPQGISDLGKRLRRVQQEIRRNATFVPLGGAVEMINELVRTGHPPWDVP